MNRIGLYRWTKGEVIAHYIGPHAAEMERLFGDAHIPTPFLFDSCLNEAGIAERRASVLARIQALNPGVEVFWER